MSRAFPWIALAIFLLSVFIDIPKHQFSFPFPATCPGVCLNLGPIPTPRISWDQPHEGNLFDHLYARRAFQSASA